MVNVSAKWCFGAIWNISIVNCIAKRRKKSKDVKNERQKSLIRY